MSIHRQPAARARAAGLSLVELLVSLAISSLVLTATMVALDASFRSYADASTLASSQTVSRLVGHRIMKLIRTSTAHGPLLPDPNGTFPVTIAGNTLTSPFVEVIDPEGDLIRAEYRANTDQLWLIMNPGNVGSVAQPLIDNVTQCRFFLERRLSDDGIWVLDRATMDLTVASPADSTLSVERSNVPEVRIVTSTTPRLID